MEVRIKIEDLQHTSKRKVKKDADGIVEEDYVETKIVITSRDVSPESIGRLHRILALGNGDIAVSSPQIEMNIVGERAV